MDVLSLVHVISPATSVSGVSMEPAPFSALFFFFKKTLSMAISDSTSSDSHAEGVRFLVGSKI